MQAWGVCEVTPLPPGASGDAGAGLLPGSTVLMGLWDRDAVSVEAVISMALDIPLSTVDNKNIFIYIYI